MTGPVNRPSGIQCSQSFCEVPGLAGLFGRLAVGESALESRRLVQGAVAVEDGKGERIFVLKYHDRVLEQNATNKLDFPSLGGIAVHRFQLFRCQVFRQILGYGFVAASAVFGHSVQVSIKNCVIWMRIAMKYTGYWDRFVELMTGGDKRAAKGFFRGGA